MGANRDIRIKIFIDEQNIQALKQIDDQLTKAAKSEKKLKDESDRKTKSIKKQTSGLKDDKNALAEVDKGTKTWTQNIVRNIGKVLEWAVATGVIYGSIRTLRAGIEDIVDVEYAMAGLTKVMKDGQERATGLRRPLLQLGHTYGELGEAVIEASTEWARLQLSTIEIAENARVSLLAQAVAEMQVTEATNYLIASMKQFEQSTLANLRTLDQWNELSNRMAVRAEDLARSAARAGSVINNAGDDMNYLNAMTAALVQSTGRSGQEIGNAIRTMGTYAYRVRTVTKLEEQAGIVIQNKAGQHRRFSDIISSLSMKWDIYTDAERRMIAQAVAGTRRQNEFIALMKQFPEVLDASVIAWEAMGSAEKESAILLDTARKKADSFRAGLQMIAAEYGDALLPGMKSFLDLLNLLIKVLLNAKEIILMVAGAVVLLGVKALITSGIMLKLGLAIKGLVVGFASLNPWLIAVIAAAAVVGLAWRSLRREIENTTMETIELMQKERDVVGALRARGERLEWLAGKYEIVSAAVARTGDSKLKDVLRDLGKDIESAGRALDKGFRFNADKAAESLARVRDMIREIGVETEDQRSKAQQTARDEVNLLRQRVRFGEAFVENLESGMSKNLAFIKAFKSTFGDITNLLFEMTRHMKGTGLVGKLLGQYLPADLKDAKEAVGTLNAALEEMENIVKTLEPPEKFFDGLEQAVDLAEKLKEVMRELRNEIDAMNEAARHATAMGEMAGDKQVDGLVRQADAIKRSIELTKERAKEFGEDEKAAIAFGKLLDTLNKRLLQTQNRIVEARRAMSFEEITEAVQKAREEFQQLASAQMEVASGLGENVKAAQLNIRSLELQRTAVASGIAAHQALGFATEDLEKDLADLNGEIALEKRLLGEVIGPQDEDRRAKDATTASEKLYGRYLNENNAVLNRRMDVMRASGASEEAIALARIAHITKMIRVSLGYNLELQTRIDLENELKDAVVDLDAAERARMERGIVAQYEREGQAIQRNLDLAKAYGASDVQMSQLRIAAIKDRVVSLQKSGMSYGQIFAEMIKLSDEMKDATNELKIAEIGAAREVTENWIKEYERRYKAWEKIIAKGLSRKGLLGTMERISEEMMSRWIQKSFGALIEKLTQWEMNVLGVSPEQIRVQDENRQKMIGALSQGGEQIRQQMVRGGAEAAGMIGAAMSGKAVGAPAGIPGLPGISQYAAPLGPPKPPTGWETAGAYGLAMGPQVISNAPDWLEGRGGGWRMAGYGAGAIAGGLIGGPGGAAFGGMVGQQLVGGIQQLYRALSDNTEELRSPSTETLREQVGGAINRGSFGQAAQYTYYIENNISMEYLIPNRQQARQVATIIKEELGDIDSNITVGA